MKKKTQFFLIDGIFAMIILITGFMIISSNTSNQAEEVSLSIVSENLMELFSSIRVDEVCNEGVCTYKKLDNFLTDGFILNKNQTLLDATGELYSKNRKAQAGELFSNITIQSRLVRKDIFGVEFRINNEVLYSQGENKAKSKELISTKKVIFGYYETIGTGAVTFFGPYLAEVDIWQE